MAWNGPLITRLSGLNAHPLIRHHMLLHALLGEDATLESLARRALDLAHRQKERGNEAWVLRLLGDIAAHADPPDLESAEGHYTQAFARATELGMRPLVAHCHLGLGKLCHSSGDHANAKEHLTTAVTLYRELDMGFWLEKAEAELGPPHRNSD